MIAPILHNERDYEIMCKGKINTIKTEKLALDTVSIFYPDAEFSRKIKPGLLLFYSPDKHEFIHVKWDSEGDV